MKAIVQRRYGGAEALELTTVDCPRIEGHQVLVRVRAAGVDRGAYHLMRGLPYVVRLMGTGLRRPKQPVPGTNFAGIVDAVGADVDGFRPGDQVYGCAHGTFAEYAAADHAAIAPKPAALAFDEAAVLPYSATVALQALRERADVQPGQSVLVVGASGAVGTIAVQIAKALGAEVTGVCRSENAPLVRGLGADRTVSYDLDEVAGRHQVVVDVGGNTPVARLRRSLTDDGRLIIVGGEQGGRILGGIHRQLGAHLRSPFVSQHLGSLIARDDHHTLHTINGLVDGGSVRPVMGRTVELVDTADAIDDLDHRRTRGRLAVIP
jgi:NADPH:quinone reductase-like Zn-dependent oxidoreductase